MKAISEGAKDRIVISRTQFPAAMNLTTVINEKIEPKTSNDDSSGPSARSGLSLKISLYISRIRSMFFVHCGTVLRPPTRPLNKGTSRKLSNELSGPSKSKQSVKALFSRDSRKGNGRVKQTVERGRRRNSLNPRTEDFWKDCGSEKHVRGDQSRENPSFYTLRPRESKEKDDRRSKKRDSEKNGEGSDSSRGKFFHSGSSPKRV